MTLTVESLFSGIAAGIVAREHYMHRAPAISFAFGLYADNPARAGQLGLLDNILAPANIVGVVTFGQPGSREVQIGACPSNPDCVIELNRLWVDDVMPRNTESWFVSRALRQMPPRIVVSYADTAHGHLGYVYRAMNFEYAGWTDMERKTPRLDYLVPGKHTRDAFRHGVPQWSATERRKPKVKYWTVTGDRRQARHLFSACGWPRLNWKTMPPPSIQQTEETPWLREETELPTSEETAATARHSSSSAAKGR